jgi:hypothetical protein
MPTISITVSDAFVAAVQGEATIDGVTANAWAKAVIKAAIEARRIERARNSAEAQRITATRTAAAQAQAAYDAAVAAEQATVTGLN